MHQKRTNKLFLLTTWRMALFTKRAFFCSFLNVIFLEKKVICTFCLAKCIRKGQNNCSFWLHEEWLSPQKEQLLCSFLNVIFLEKNVICIFCLAKCIIKGKKIVPFDYMTFKKNVICTFFPYKMHQKRKKNCSLLTTWRMALFTKRAFFVPFWMSSF